ncbi:hypothetical protein [[Clostridium] aminophilum]|uniref:Uncharacterized protein n=1 Tax=[Clostridium] aminophilum TaxID=1526 RepID=A0A1I6KM18_9FIRM|nr:hypothetical protein [[Clostridium] aminophilum]SFR92239.1 hypothetical protein SAMN02910262_02656 [[Clostridium] aminophilum]
MKWNGKMTVLLTDTASGKTESVTKKNMITEAVNDVFSSNPFGVFYDAGEARDEVRWNESFLPICPNLIGGILFFGKGLEEKADGIFAPADNLPVAYASNQANSSANVARGSLNLSESKVLENGYKFVWDFSPSQGNGRIVAAALTSSWGGQNALGSTDGAASVFLPLKSVAVGDLPATQRQMLFDAVEFDFEKEILTSITYENSSVMIRKIRIPFLTLGINEKLHEVSMRILEEETISAPDFVWNNGFFVKGDFFDGGDGAWYGFSTEGNSSGDATLHWVKISKEDRSVESGTWTLPRVCLNEKIGSRSMPGEYGARSILSVMRGGYLYVVSYDKKGIYKINANNPTDVTLINLGETTEWKSISESGSTEVYLAVVNGVIMGWDFLIDGKDQVTRIGGGVRLKEAATPLFAYRNFLVQWGGAYGSSFRTVYLLTPYLASINNLERALEKTPEKTMKVTYTLTQEE